MNQLAFPQPEPIFNEFHKDYGKDRGMTLRDYFAARALPAILDQKDVHDSRELTNAAWIAYQMADAMLKAREA